jgi:hypothetical protein
MRAYDTFHEFMKSETIPHQADIFRGLSVLARRHVNTITQIDLPPAPHSALDNLSRATVAPTLTRKYRKC